MKKMKKIVAIFLAVWMCASLCGCRQLDEMRAIHAIVREDGTILWNDQVYLPLENVPETFAFQSENRLVVTKPDVPVLLSEMEGGNFSMDKEGVILHTWYWEGYEGYYCREDRHAEMTEYIRKGVNLNTYYYSYWSRKDDQMQHYYLTDDQRLVVDKLMDETEFVDMYYNFYDSFEVDEYTLTLDKCDDTRLFHQNFAIQLAFKDGTYYLITQDNRIGVVPAEFYPTMYEIAEKYYEAELKFYVEPYTEME